MMHYLKRFKCILAKKSYQVAICFFALCSFLSFASSLSAQNKSPANNPNKEALISNDIANPDVDYDIAFVTGGNLTVITDIKNKISNIGGLVLGVQFYRDYSKRWSSFASPQLVIDAVTRQATRKGGEIGLLYHVLGGGRLYKRDFGIAKTTVTNGHYLALGMRTGYYMYTAVPIEPGAPLLKGSTIDVAFGLDSGFEMTKVGYLGLQLYAGIVSFPTSVEAISARPFDALIYWRTFI